AIALCNKILRLAPGHDAIHLRLGLISALKGFRRDARRHLGEYLETMERADRLDDALDDLVRNAETLVDHDGDHQGELRGLVGELLRAHGREAEAAALLETTAAAADPGPPV